MEFLSEANRSAAKKAADFLNEFVVNRCHDKEHSDLYKKNFGDVPPPEINVDMDDRFAIAKFKGNVSRLVINLQHKTRNHTMWENAFRAETILSGALGSEMDLRIAAKKAAVNKADSAPTAIKVRP